MDKQHLETFTSAFMEALYFTDTGDIDQPDSSAEIDADSLELINAECLVMWDRIGCFVISEKTLANFADIESAIVQAGHDFWYSRNGHGTGFWDNYNTWPDCYATMFDTWAKNLGDFDTYETATGEIAIA